MSPAPLHGKAMFILCPQIWFRISILVLYWNLVLWGHCEWISKHLENFLWIEIWFEKKVSFSKPPPTPFRQSPPKQQGSWNHTFLRGKDKPPNVVLEKDRWKAVGERRKHDKAWYWVESFWCFNYEDKKNREIRRIVKGYVDLGMGTIHIVDTGKIGFFTPLPPGTNYIVLFWLTLPTIVHTIWGDPAQKKIFGQYLLAIKHK